MKQIITCEYIKECLVAHDYTRELVSTEYVNCAFDPVCMKEVV